MLEGTAVHGKPPRTNSRKYSVDIEWASDHFVNFRCLEHVVNIAVVTLMGCITKIAAVENTTAIWEYDPDLPDNQVLGGSLDVIAAIRTIAIKVCIIKRIGMINLPWHQIQASGQRIEYFEKLQIQCKIADPLRIPLHSNVRWGSAYRMLDRSYKLRQVSQIQLVAINTYLNFACIANWSFLAIRGLPFRPDYDHSP